MGDGMLTAREGDLKLLGLAVNTLQSDLASVQSPRTDPSPSSTSGGGAMNMSSNTIASCDESMPSESELEMQELVKGLRSELEGLSASKTAMFDPAEMDMMKMEAVRLAQTAQ